MVVTPALVAGIGINKDTVVLKLDNDNAVNLAVNTFLEDNPRSIVVEYRTIEASLVLSSKINNLVIIGHGFKEGVLIKNNIVSWKSYSRIVKSFSASDIFLLNCQSDNVQEYLEGTNTKVYTLDKDIDARIAGMYASIMVNRHDKNFVMEKINSFFDLVANINDKILQSVNLGYSGFEPAYYIIAIIIMILAAVVDAAASSNAARTGVEKWAAIMATHHITLIVAAVSWWQGAMTALQFAGEALGFLDEAAVGGNLLNYIFNELSAWDYAIWGVTLLASIIAAIVSGSASMVLKIAIYTYLLVSFIAGMIQDGIDCDGVIGQDSSVSCSPPPDDGGGGGGGGGGSYYLV